VRSLRAKDRPALFVMNTDGTGGLRLTSTILSERQPAWSPDATRLVYAARTSPGGPFRLFLINADGSGRIQLTDESGDGDDLAPAWAPDGSRIAFSSTRDGGFPEIYTVRADGTGTKRLQLVGMTEVDQFQQSLERLIEIEILFNIHGYIGKRIHAKMTP